ncbi:MAG: GNAT family N-acetyltransferase [Thermoflexibacter sp.]|jgi:amino-acid N-acetyltransferase|nr:GNAT family N-acetyltransferase [Thermoflexibacter sp.]
MKNIDNINNNQSFIIKKVFSSEDRLLFIGQLVLAHLPYADLREDTDKYLAYCQNDLVGTIGLEWYGRYVLLRSLSVHESYRSAGIGRQIIAEIEKIVQSKNGIGIFLLTESAKDFFVKNAYTVINRQSIPQEVLSAPQFVATCPSTATAMVKLFES